MSGHQLRELFYFFLLENVILDPSTLDEMCCNNLAQDPFMEAASCCGCGPLQLRGLLLEACHN